MKTCGDVGQRNESSALDAEARLFSQYLVDQLPPEELIERYRRANLELFHDPPGEHETALLDFVRRHPWSLPFMDGAAGIRSPNGLLRKKILVLAAILETTSRFAGEFLPRQRPLVPLLWTLAFSGTMAVCQTLIGLAMYPMASGGRK